MGAHAVISTDLLRVQRGHGAREHAIASDGACRCHHLHPALGVAGHRDGSGCGAGLVDLVMVHDRLSVADAVGPNRCRNRPEECCEKVVSVELL